MTALSQIWDGELHELTPGEDFSETGATLVIDGWEELEEEDVLSLFESPSRVPILRDTDNSKPGQDKLFPMHKTEQGWASLSITLTAFSKIIGVEKQQYQNVNHTTKASTWTFQARDAFAERV